MMTGVSNYRFWLLIVVSLVFSMISVDSSLSAQTSPDNKAESPSLRPAQKVPVEPREAKPVKPRLFAGSVNTLDRARKDGRVAKRLARYHWLDKLALAQPELIEAITNHKSAAEILARHPRIAEIAEADHYLCRRITKWKSAARILAGNTNCRNVISLDPEGIYRAVRRDRKIARILAKNPRLDQMIAENPDLGRYIAHFM